MRKIATALVGIGLMVGLVGAGIGAQFTDSATATVGISVGTFNIDISTTMSGCTVVDGTSVTCTLPTIQSSAAGSASFPFTITNTGSMPATIAISASTPAAPFSAVAVTAVSPLAAGAHTDYSGGVAWTELHNSDLGASVSVTYTISATN